MDEKKEYNRDILDNYIEKWTKYIGPVKEKTRKMSGSFFAHLMKMYIDGILASYEDKNYITSVVNSYIEGCPIEWDLLILKKGNYEDACKYNIYNPENVICAIEFKTSGAIFSKKNKDDPDAIDTMAKYFKKYMKYLSKNNIKYAYISLCDYDYIIKDAEVAADEINNVYCHWIIKGRYKLIEKEDAVEINGKEELKKFIEEDILEIKNKEE